MRIEVTTVTNDRWITWEVAEVPPSPIYFTGSLTNGVWTFISVNEFNLIKAAAVAVPVFSLHKNDDAVVFAFDWFPVMGAVIAETFIDMLNVLSFLFAAQTKAKQSACHQAYSTTHQRPADSADPVNRCATQSTNTHSDTATNCCVLSLVSTADRIFARVKGAKVSSRSLC
jgi:hypothetical protein